jgi:hypothetical protein
LLATTLAAAKVDDAAEAAGAGVAVAALEGLAAEEELAAAGSVLEALMTSEGRGKGVALLCAVPIMVIGAAVVDTSLSVFLSEFLSVFFALGDVGELCIDSSSVPVAGTTVGNFLNTLCCIPCKCVDEPIMKKVLSRRIECFLIMLLPLK